MIWQYVHFASSVYFSFVEKRTCTPHCTRFSMHVLFMHQTNEPLYIGVFIFFDMYLCNE